MTSFGYNVLGFGVSGSGFTATLSSNTNQANLRSIAVSQGWNEVQKLNFIINSGVYAFSSSTGSYAPPGS